MGQNGRENAQFAAGFFNPDQNCWRVRQADRLALVVDGEDYFAALRQIVSQAQHELLLIGWDFDFEIEMLPGESDGDGTKFWFVLPYQEVADFATLQEKTTETVANIKEEATYALRGAKVLLAEDEYINRVLIEKVLEQLGVDVFSVASGEEAVEEACSGKHEFILMDIQMDGVDGLEATKRIRSYEKKHGGHIPIVALTAHAMVGDREKCLRAGMDEYLRKPVDRKEILEVLTEYLTSRALVVDSDIESQNVFVKNLVESGWQVTIAETKRSAMYEATLNHFDLIILDTSSSQIKGLEAVKTIRQLEQYTGQRATIISLDEDGTVKEKQDENAFDGTIVRPVTREKLLAHLSA